MQGNPTTERYWDGTGWSDAFRPVGPVAPPPPFAGQGAADFGSTGNASKPLWKKKRVLVPVGLVVALVGLSVLAAGGSSDDEEPAADTVAPLAGDTEAQGSAEPADDPTDAAGETSDETDKGENDAVASDAPDPGAKLGTRENPYPFGQSHVREPGLMGAG
ncbi:MAG: DUF2510 domain-containing protein [Actinomycetota bacterium]|nr:DUF2510 domain-containing protein [Actinomycetota bacterium]